MDTKTTKAKTSLLTRNCSICGKAHKSGTHVSRIGKLKLNVLNYEPKPYKHVEYWECEKCYKK